MPVLPIIKMARTVTRSLLRGSACKMYPKREPKFYSSTRGEIEIDTSKCILCGLCAKKCPGGAIAVEREEKTWEIDRLKCILCGICVENCPKKSLSLLNTYTRPTTVKTKDLLHVEPPHPSGT